MNHQKRIWACQIMTEHFTNLSAKAGPRPEVLGHSFDPPLRTMQTVPPHATSMTLPMPPRSSFLGLLICWSSDTEENCPYSELPHPKTSPRSAIRYQEQ